MEPQDAYKFIHKLEYPSHKAYAEISMEATTLNDNGKEYTLVFPVIKYKL